MNKMTTREKIIQAALELVTESGYKGATTRLIAERAGVNEVTLFRHFGNKRGIVEAAIERFSFMDELEEVLQHSIEWDIEKDLRLIAKIYHERLGSKREIVLVSFREAYQFPELDAQISRLPKRFQAFLTEYFTEMIKREKIRAVDPHIAATNFIYMSAGYFLLEFRLSSDGEAIPLDTYLNDNIQLFVDSLK